jgi:hypothetical protein
MDSCSFVITLQFSWQVVEFARKQGNAQSSLPVVQPAKLNYAMLVSTPSALLLSCACTFVGRCFSLCCIWLQLADCGLVRQAGKYADHIRAVVKECEPRGAQAQAQGMELLQFVIDCIDNLLLAIRLE